jgi:hypothetical protein
MSIKKFIGAALLWSGMSFGVMAAAPAIDQTSSASCAGCGGTTTGPAITISTSGTNELVILLIGGDKVAGGAITWTPSGCGLTWTLRASATGILNGTPQFAMQEYWAAAASQLSACTVTTTSSVNQDAGTIIQFSLTGVASLVTPFDSNVSLPSATTSNRQPPSASISTNQAAFIFAAYTNSGNNNNGLTLVSGSSLIQNIHDGAHNQDNTSGSNGGSYSTFKSSFTCCTTGNTPFGAQGVIVDAIAGTGGGATPSTHTMIIIGEADVPSPYLIAFDEMHN